MNLFLVDALAECLFEPTVVYLNEHGLCVGGAPIADAVKPTMQTIVVGKIRKVLLTERAFVINPVINRFDIAYAGGIICLAATSA